MALIYQAGAGQELVWTVIPANFQDLTLVHGHNLGLGPFPSGNVLELDGMIPWC